MFDPVLFAALMSSTAAFTPLSLFAAGEQGAWYDPSDFSTMFQDAAGTTPVTAVEQPVGLIRDKSGRGNHASQSTAASRPVLSARVNQLTYTEQFDNAAWVKQGVTVSSNQTTAPDGTNTADMVVVNNGSQTVGVYQDVTTLTASTNYTVSACVKKNGAQYAVVGWIYSAGIYGAVAYDLDTQLISRSAVAGGFTIISSSITPLGNEWYRISVTATVPSTGGFSRFPAVFPRVTAWTSGTPEQTDTGDGVKGIYIWGADLRVTNAGVNLPAYQRVGAAVTATTNPAVTGVPDYDTSGFPLYLKFDGTDDSLATGTIDPGAVDKAQVFAGVRKLSDAGGLNIIAEFGPVVDSTVGTFAIGNSIGNASRWLSALRGSAALVYYEPATYAAPITNIVTSLFDIAGAGISTEILPRVNSVLVQTNPTGASTGAGNFSAQSLSIGQRSSTASLRFNGQLYSMILRFSAANLSDAQIASTETYVNNLTKAY